MKILNLYAGVGGNARDWRNDDVTHIEIEPDWDEFYKLYLPDDPLRKAMENYYKEIADAQNTLRAEQRKKMEEL